MSATPLLLFGTPVSLYTGKVRCYLRKQGIAYTERLPSDPVFQKELLPRLQRFMIPVIQAADGAVVQDSADIIDWCETRGLARAPTVPQPPLQRITALLLDLYGEGLVRAAMHYRWSYRSENEAYLRYEFGMGFRTGRQPPEVVERRLDEAMAYYAAYLPKFGITTQTIPAIEASYEALLKLLDDHFRQHPYALGGAPCIADYGLIAPLYAHLARDPYPARLMKLRAPSLYRWTERMNAADADTPEFPRYAPALPANDQIPETLEPLLHHIAADWLPELRATVAALDAWLAANAGAEAINKPLAGRNLCECSFKLRGTDISAGAQPYTLYKLQRLTDAYASLAGDERERVRSAMAAAGLEPLLILGANRRVVRRDFLEWWGS